MKKEQARLNYLAFTGFIEELVSGPSTSAALTEVTGLHFRTVNRLLRLMHERKLIHVSGWEKDALGRIGVRVYSFGAGKDAKRPNKPREQVNRDYRERAANAPLKGTPFYGLIAANDGKRRAA